MKIKKPDRSREDIVESILNNSKKRDIMEKDLTYMVDLICYNVQEEIINDPTIKLLLSK